ncbi:MAG: hypothetical protein AAF871_01460 [Pseudomonadota bacterium]
MYDIIDRIRHRAAQHSAYLKTVSELRRMPLDTALDLDIYRGDIKKIAHRAVYGRG